MCGITGIYAFNTVGRVHLIHLEAATRRLALRGPDAHQTWFDEDRVGLGHRRLSVIDPSESANQPFWDASRRYCMVFNGEIYNYQTLREELRGVGATFVTASDTEVLLHAYMVWGRACLDRLNGFFAFAIYDTQAGELFLARDRYGIKPLYYYRDDSKIVFASELKSLMTYQLPKEIDKTSLHLYFQLTYIPAPRTIFKDVCKLLPGQYLVVNAESVETKTYYELPDYGQPPITNLEVAKKELRRTLTASVERRLVADVPLGTFLSGGIDSSIITALAAERKKGLKTFSIGFAENEYFDETAYARIVAEKYQTDHQEFKVSNEDLIACVSQVTDYLDEPFADSSALPVYILSELTKKYVTVALSGDGADELFAGYNKHSAWVMSHESSKANGFVSALSGLWRVLPKSRYTRFSDTIRKLHKYAELLKMQEQEKYWFLATFIAEHKVDRLLRADWKPDESVLASFKRRVLSQVKGSAIKGVLRTDSRLVLEGDMLTKVDRMSMANSLEVRVPFLDSEVVNVAFGMVDDLKIDGQSRKIVLRSAFQDLLPEELFNRQKQGFEVPLLGWFQKELKQQLAEVVFNKEKIQAQGIFAWDEISRLKRQLYALDPGDVHIQIWSLFVFQRWYDRYFSCS